jgi:hypothetical protein
VAEHSVDRPGVAGRVGFYVRRALSHVRDWFT